MSAKKPMDENSIKKLKLYDNFPIHIFSETSTLASNIRYYVNNNVILEIDDPDMRILFMCIFSDICEIVDPIYLIMIIKNIDTSFNVETNDDEDRILFIGTLITMLRRCLPFDKKNDMGKIDINNHITDKKIFGITKGKKSIIRLSSLYSTLQKKQDVVKEIKRRLLLMYNGEIKETNRQKDDDIMYNLI
jgi:hypothetical protein